MVGTLGVTDFFNNVTLNSDRFGDSKTPVRPNDEYQFLQTMAHEMMHVNANPLEKIRDRIPYYHNRIDDKADAIVTMNDSALVQEYKRRRDSLINNICVQ
jgi:hypothetical protein